MEPWLQQEYARELAFQALDLCWDELFYPKLINKRLIELIKTGSEAEDVVKELTFLFYRYKNLGMKILAKDMLRLVEEMKKLLAEEWTLEKELNNAMSEIKPVLEDVLGRTMQTQPLIKLRSYDEKSGKLGSHPIGKNEVIIYVTNINGVTSLHIRKGVLAHELCHLLMNGAKGADWFNEGLAICLAIYVWEKLNRKNLANDFLYFVEYGSERKGLTLRLRKYREHWYDVQSIVSMIGFENVKFLILQDSETHELLLKCAKSDMGYYRVAMRKWLTELIQKPPEEVKRSLKKFFSYPPEERIAFLKEFV